MSTPPTPVIRFVMWPTEADALFREVYENLTGETVQTNPDISIDDAFYLLGSARVSEEDCAILREAVSEAIADGTDPAALGFAPKPPEE